MRPARVAPAVISVRRFSERSSVVLPEPRRADQPEHLALAHRQTHVAHNPALSIGEPHAFDAHALLNLARRRLRGYAAAAPLVGCACGNTGQGVRARQGARDRPRCCRRCRLSPVGRGAHHARLAVEHDPSHGRGHQRIHGKLPVSVRQRLGSSMLRVVLKRITSTFSASTISSNTNAAAYAFSCALPSPAGEFRRT